MALNPGLLIPFAVIATAKKSRRGRLTEAMLPAMVPLPPTQAVAMSAMVADQQVRTEERRIERARGEEIVKSRALLAAETKKTQELLAAEATKAQALLDDTVKACKLLIPKAANQKLSAAEFETLPALKALLEKTPALKAEIVA